MLCDMLRNYIGFALLLKFVGKGSEICKVMKQNLKGSYNIEL